MFLAFKEMKKEKGKFLLIISIIILISYLVFFLTGLAYGLAKDNTTAVEKWNADAIVLKSGTNANLSSSMMKKEALDDFQDLDISPINLGRVVAYKNANESKENTVDLVLMGLDQDSTAYPEVIEGELPEESNQVIASISLKEEENLTIGDTILLSMNDKEYEIVGFAEEAKYNVSPVIYTELYEASPYAMSSLQDSADNESEESEQENLPPAIPEAQTPETIAGIIVHEENDLSSDDTYDVIPIEDFILEIPGYLPQLLTFGLMIGFLILISTIVLGVFIYIITMQKKQTFGIMKVQGISNGYIARSVINQTFLVSVIGVLIGLGLTILSEYALPETVPFTPNYQFFAIIAVLIVLISLLGGIFSVRGVTKVDPLEVLD
ncbi:ABC transporter permease [Aerococcaceae bacterium DSM 111020]|nr:ABC transporter permease [Aerococcaceae bacterium DSM 111020]